MLMKLIKRTIGFFGLFALALVFLFLPMIFLSTGSRNPPGCLKRRK